MAYVNAQTAQLSEILEMQRKFLQDGGIYRSALALAKHRGELPQSYVYQEFPKMLHFAEGPVVVVEDAAEEAKVLAKRGPSLSGPGGSVEDDDESVEALEARLAGMKRKAELRRQIAEMAAAEALEAAAQPMADADVLAELKADLLGLGVRVDPKWDIARMQKELERATAKGA